MRTDRPSESDSSIRILPALAVLVGALVFGLGVLLLPESRLGGSHVAAIGLSLCLSGLLTIRRIADRLNLSPAAQRTWSVAFAALALVLLILFAVLNGATFEGGEFEGGSDTG